MVSLPFVLVSFLFVCVIDALNGLESIHRQGFMKKSSNARYIVWTLTEFVIVATLFIQFSLTSSE